MMFAFKTVSAKLAMAALLLASAVFADNDPAIFRPEKSSARDQVTAADTTKENDIMLKVNIFGDMPVGSYYIFWDEVDLSEEMKKLMTTREFAKDEFFMQNIDREQFEQEHMLMLFEDQKREFFRIYPEELLKQLEEEKADQ